MRWFWPASVRARGRARHARLAALLLAPLLLSGCMRPEGRELARVRLSGAQIATELVESWLGSAVAQRFDVQKSFPVYLSQHGFEALRERRCDVACTDRRIGPVELREFGDRKLVGLRIAFYGYALYVNRQNPLDSVFARHVGLLFEGKVHDWKELATTPIPSLSGPIALYGPEKSSRGGMVLSPLARIWFDQPAWKTLESDAEIIRRVAADPAALGFATIGYDNDQVRYLGLRMERSAAPAFPSLEEIESERYGLAKVIYIYYESPASRDVGAVRDYLMSEAGRRAIESTGMWAIAADRASVDETTAAAAPRASPQ